MKFLLHILISLFCHFGLHGQNTIDQTLKKSNNNSVPYISAEDLTQNDEFLLLDTREKREFEVSHLKNAIWVGHREFDADYVSTLIPNKNTPIVVYCSIGVRSENIGGKLLKTGYSNVYNLYGGIFEWKNKDFPIYDTIGKETERVHAFSKHWGKMLTKGTKVYGQRKQKN